MTKSDRIGAIGVKRALEYLHRKDLKPEYIHDNRQFTHGDIETQNGYIEVKTEENWTGNLFIETWSNRPKRRGWLFNLEQCDYLFYYFLNRPGFTCLNIPKLRELFLEGDDISIEAVFAAQGSAERQAGKYVQPNETWGLCVPVEFFFEQRLGKPIEWDGSLFHPKQPESAAFGSAGYTSGHSIGR